MIVPYISGKYTEETYEGIEAHISEARELAAKLWDLGYPALCPHTNAGHFELYSKATYDTFLYGDIELMCRCDAVIMLDNWKDSRGAKLEHDTAIESAIPVFYSLEEFLAWVEAECVIRVRAR